MMFTILICHEEGREGNKGLCSQEEVKQMFCEVLDAFEDKRVIPKWSQCCYNIPHRDGMPNDKEPYTAKQIQEGPHGFSKPKFHLSEPLKRHKIHIFALKALIFTYQASNPLYLNAKPLFRRETGPCD